MSREKQLRHLPKFVSFPILQLYRMPKSQISKRCWRQGVHLAEQIHAMFKPRSRAKLQSLRHPQLSLKYDGGSRKLTIVIDVSCPKYRVLRLRQLRCNVAHCRASFFISLTRIKSYHLQQSETSLDLLRDTNTQSK